MENTGHGEIKKYVGGYPHLAYVDVTTHLAGEIKVVDNCRDSEYSEWKRAATVGIRFAIAICGQKLHVSLDRVAGAITDTDATAMAIAAARSVWDSISYTPNPAIQCAIEQQLWIGWDRNAEVTPYFHARLEANG